MYTHYAFFAPLPLIGQVKTECALPGSGNSGLHERDFPLDSAKHGVIVKYCCTHGDH